MAQEIIAHMGFAVTLDEAKRLNLSFQDVPGVLQDAAAALDGLSAVLAQDVADPAALAGLLSLASRGLQTVADEHQAMCREFHPRLTREIDKVQKHRDAFAAEEAARTKGGKANGA